MTAVMWVQTLLLLIQIAVLAWTACLIKRYTDEAFALRKATERYTDETAGLRQEMVRQNKLALRPIVLPAFKLEGGRPVFCLTNVGNGCAVNITVSPRKIAEELSFEVRLKAPDYLAVGQQCCLEASYWIGDKPHSPSAPNAYYAPFAEGLTQGREDRVITFADIEGQGYELQIAIWPGQPLPSRVELGPVQAS
jgi:hypothetical protein